ncbi:hypothetical protein [Actinoplanes subglobosus]|uniref:Uncharacterized protein n=1 Tax=Actinoplanes subglobosus TaxID=1547892 RepID=A0ABV8IUX5_9ACTN
MPTPRSITGFTAALLLLTTLAPVAAHAAPNTNTPYPVFKGDANPVPDDRTGYHTRNQLQAIFEADVAARAGSAPGQDFWIDRMLARTGNQPGGSNGDANQHLFSRAGSRS